MWCSFALPRHRKKSEVMPGFVCIHSYWNENIYSQHERWHSGQVPKFSSGFLFFIYVHVWTLMIKCYCQLCHHVRAIMSNCPSYSFSLRQKRGKYRKTQEPDRYPLMWPHSFSHNAQLCCCPAFGSQTFALHFLFVHILQYHQNGRKLKKDYPCLGYVVLVFASNT